MDLFVVPTISFRLLYGFLILRHSRREILWLGESAHPSAQWIGRQLSEAFGVDEAARSSRFGESICLSSYLANPLSRSQN